MLIFRIVSGINQSKTIDNTSKKMYNKIIKRGDNNRQARCRMADKPLGNDIPRT